MISNKVWTANGQTKRFLSDFIILSEQHCRVYNYIYDAGNGSDILDILDPTTGLFIRATDAPQSSDLITLDKFDLINNSIAFYVAPVNTSKVYIEVATTPEEFGDIINQSQAGAAEGFANTAEQYATLAQEALAAFDEKYMGASATNPITGMVTGSAYFNTTDNELRIYNGSAWISLTSMIETTIVRETFTSIDGPLTFTIVTPFDHLQDMVNVYINGVFQESADFTMNADNTITLGTALEVGDTMEVIVFQTTVTTSDYVTYVDQEVQGAKDYADAQDVITLASANSYTDSFTITTNTVITVPTDFADINLALKSLDNKTIASDVTVTINVLEGEYTYTEPVVISHSNSDRIIIKGATYQSLGGLTGFVSATGAAGDWEVTLNVTDSSILSVNDWVIVSLTSGVDSHVAIRGIWKVLAINSPTQIVILHTSENASFPTMTLSSGNIWKLPTVLKFTDCDGFVSRGASLGELTNFAIVGSRVRSTAAYATEQEYYDSRWGNGTPGSAVIGTHGVYVGGKTVTDGGSTNELSVSGGSFSLGLFIGVSGFTEQGIVSDGGTNVFAEYAASCSNGRRGFYAASSAAIRAKFSAAVGNHLDGYIADYGGNIYNSISVAACNGWHGMAATNGGSIATNDAFSYNNKQNGFYAKGSYLYCPTSISFKNEADGLKAEYGGTLFCDSCLTQGNSNHGASAYYNSTIRGTSIQTKNNIGTGLVAHSGCEAVVTGMVNTANGVTVYSESSTIIDGTGYYDTIDKTPRKEGIIMVTPDGLNKYRVWIDNSGILTTTLI